MSCCSGLSIPVLICCSTTIYKLRKVWPHITREVMHVSGACSKRTLARLRARLSAMAAAPPTPSGTLWPSPATRPATGPLPRGPPRLSWPASPPSTAPPWSPPAAGSMGTRAALQTTRARPPALVAAAAPARAAAAAAPHPTRPPPATLLASRLRVDDGPLSSMHASCTLGASPSERLRASPCPVGEE